MRTIDRDTARRFMLSHHGLRQNVRAVSPAAAVRKLLARARHIQLDPLDVVGTNADLVAMARIDGLAKGDVYRHLMPKHAFEHFAKERCLLPAEAFARYRERSTEPTETTWWNTASRLERLTPELIAAVLEAVRTHGPLTAAELEKHGAWGKVEALDWSGWKGTARAASMALEVLWTRCEVVVAGRVAGARGVKLWDLPERALGKHAAPARADTSAGTEQDFVAGKRSKGFAFSVGPPPHSLRQAGLGALFASGFAAWALTERARASGLLARASGPWWSTLAATRKGPLPDALVAAGVLEAVAIEGVRGAYLAPRGFLDTKEAADDGRMRILAPLDAFLWDRKLVHAIFGFDYLWEVYKPAAQRRWGYYVCPLLHRGALVGRFEGRVVPSATHADAREPRGQPRRAPAGASAAFANELTVVGLWPEPGQRFERAAFKDAFVRHAAQLGVRAARIPAHAGR